MAANPQTTAGALLVAVLLGQWPHWQWLVRRMADGSDEPWGGVALVTLAALIGREFKAWQTPKPRRLALVAGLSVAASASWGWLPALISTAGAVLALGVLVAGLLPARRPATPLLLLALLALPLAASLNFYLGYPLRWFCAQTTAMILVGLGLSVTPQGAALWWNGQPILIDAACAGIAMLWLGWYLTVLLAWFNRLAALSCWVNLVAATAIMVVANVLRNVLLFYKESGLVPLPHWTHEAIGLLVFGAVVPSIYFVSLRGKGKEVAHE